MSCDRKTEQMRLLWLIAPAPSASRGGQGNPLPPPFERPANIKLIQAQQRFIRPEKE